MHVGRYDIVEKDSLSDFVKICVAYMPFNGHLGLVGCLSPTFLHAFNCFVEITKE